MNISNTSSQPSWLAQNWFYIILIVFVIIIIVAFILFIENFNPFCIGPLSGGSLCEVFGGLLGSGTTQGSEQGEFCSASTDCKGWSLVNNIGCCGSTCVTLDSASEDCPQFCGRHPEAKCGLKLGQTCSFDRDCNNWTIGGDVACCNNKCVIKDETLQTCNSLCSSNPQACGLPAGAQWCIIDFECPGSSPIPGVSSVACCNNRCVTKEGSFQTCPAFCESRPDLCATINN